MSEAAQQPNRGENSPKGKVTSPQSQQGGSQHVNKEVLGCLGPSWLFSSWSRKSPGAKRKPSDWAIYGRLHRGLSRRPRRQRSSHHPRTSHHGRGRTSRKRVQTSPTGNIANHSRTIPKPDNRGGHKASWGSRVPCHGCLARLERATATLRGPWVLTLAIVRTEAGTLVHRRLHASAWWGDLFAEDIGNSDKRIESHAERSPPFFLCHVRLSRAAPRLSDAGWPKASTCPSPPH